MKKSHRISLHAGLWLLAIVVATSCTLDVNSAADDTITEADLEAAGQILGESLSDDNSGVMLSLDDAMTLISSEGFGNAKAKSGNAVVQDDRSGRGRETDYSYSYDPETGTHTVSFKRQIQSPVFSKTVTDTLKYIFTTNSGEFVEFPRQNRERIEAIDFTGRREGALETKRKESFFVRRDTFAIDGISTASSVLTINGVHHGRGSINVNRPEQGQLERSYQLEINFLNIEIEKAVVDSARGLQRGVTGTLSWHMTIERSGNGQSGTKTIRGTIELNGDGTALLRFRNFLKRFQINLDNGDVKDQDKEFEGRIRSVSIDAQSITFVGGRTVYLTENTEFDDDEYPSLRAVQKALDDGFRVWAEGEGFVRDDRFIVTEIEFEREDDDEEDNSDDQDDDGDDGNDEDEGDDENG